LQIVLKKQGAKAPEGGKKMKTTINPSFGVEFNFNITAQNDEIDSLNNEVDILRKEYKAIRLTHRLLSKDAGTKKVILNLLVAEQDRIKSNIDALAMIVNYLKED